MEKLDREMIDLWTSVPGLAERLEKYETEIVDPNIKKIIQWVSALLTGGVILHPKTILEPLSEHINNGDSFE